MPLTPLHSWEESPTAVKIVTEAPGLTQAKSDLLICDNFLRVNFPPYLLQLDLLNHIDDTNCKAVFGVGSVTCYLEKVQPILWGQLTAQGSKRELQDRRRQAQQRLELRLQKEQQERQDQKEAINKAASDKRIEIDKQKREAIELHKRKELQAQKADVMSWQETVATPDQAESDYEDEDILNSPELSSQDNDQYHGKGWRTKKARAPSRAVSMLPTNDETHTVYLEEQAIWSANAEPHVTKQDANSQQSSSTVYAEEAPVTSRAEADSLVHLPPVRSACAPVAVQFTKLETDHLPARETREQEISSYKRKAQETRVSDDNVDMSERQPMFLKDRGDTRHRSGNFRAAINAYSKALEIDASLTVCYANRAASCLKAQEYRLCIDDCTTALIQMEEAMCESAAGSSASGSTMNSSMVKLLTRRAAAYVELHDMQHAEADLQEAMKRHPNDANLKADVREVQASLQPADTKTLRAIADQRFRNQDLHGASDVYSAVIASSEAAFADKLAATSNRAACSLAQRNYSSTVHDCSLALRLLTGQDMHASFGLHAYLATEQGHALPEPQKQSLARLLARRGIALGHLSRYNEATLNLEAAQHVYIALGQLAKGNALHDDIAKVKQAQATLQTDHA